MSIDWQSVPENGTAIPGGEVPARPPDLGHSDEVKQAAAELRALQEHASVALERLLASMRSLLERARAESEQRVFDLENRVRVLERELEQTRRRLSQTEGLLESATLATGTSGAASPAAIAGPAGIPLVSPPESEDSRFGVPASDEGEPNAASRSGLTLEQVQAIQRHFNESPAVEKTRSVRRSLGRPCVNVSCLAGVGTKAIVTVAWEIVWYQYLVDFAPEVDPEVRVTLFAEGMELDELSQTCREPNAMLDDEGRLDASEIEVRLLSDPSTLITEMPVDQQRELEDATEEIWNQHSAPEFRWDD